MNMRSVSGPMKTPGGRPRPSGYRPNRWWIWLIAVPLALAAAELLARLVVSDAAGNSAALAKVLFIEEGAFKLRPGVEFGGNGGTINSRGLRGSEAREGAIRVALLGGDSVFGGRIERDDKTLSGEVERRLNASGGARFQVLNAGAPRGTGLSAAKRLRGELAPIGIHAVVLLVGHEDAFAMASETPVPALSLPVASGWLDNIALVRVFRGARKDESAAALPAAPPVAEAALGAGRTRFIAGLRELIDLCREMNVGLLLAAEPSLVTRATAEHASERAALLAAAGLTDETWASAWKRVTSLMSSLAELNDGVWYVDLAAKTASSGVNPMLAAFAHALPGGGSAGDEARYYLPYHLILGAGLSEAGCEAAGKELYAELTRLMPWKRAGR